MNRPYITFSRGPVDTALQRALAWVVWGLARVALGESSRWAQLASLLGHAGLLAGAVLLDAHRGGVWTVLGPVCALSAVVDGLADNYRIPRLARDMAEAGDAIPASVRRHIDVYVRWRLIDLAIGLVLTPPVGRDAGPFVVYGVGALVTAVAYHWATVFFPPRRTARQAVAERLSAVSFRPRLIPAPVPT